MLFQFGMRPGRQQAFETQYQCYSMAMVDKAHLDDGDKILLPPSALNILSHMEVEYPMLFELRNDALGRKTHCGVSEFTAEEGKCHIPFFIMQTLLVEEGSIISLKNVSLQKASYIKVRAQSVDFLDITNPRAVLEVTLRKYTCVTIGDQIVLQHLNKLFYLEVQDVKPNGAASIVETDVEIDFDEPVGYKDSEYAKRFESKETSKAATPATFALPLQKAKASPQDESQSQFKPFSGQGMRIDGRVSASKAAAVTSAASVSVGTTGGTSSTSSSHIAVNGTATASALNPAPSYNSIIGDKFSKRKNAASAFSGSAYKLN